jgi:hypothetical protein
MSVVHASQPPSGSYQAFGPETLDAIALLLADHRHLEDLFAELETRPDVQRKQELAARICRTMRLHRTLEEEIFYPALLEVTRDEDSYDEALEAHAMAAILIEDIEQSGPAEPLFDAKLQILCDMFRLHIAEEETPNGLFAEAAARKLDLEALGAEMRHLREAVTREMFQAD